MSECVRLAFYEMDVGDATEIRTKTSVTCCTLENKRMCQCFMQCAFPYQEDSVELKKKGEGG